MTHFVFFGIENENCFLQSIKNPYNPPRAVKSEFFFNAKLKSVFISVFALANPRHPRSIGITLYDNKLFRLLKRNSLVLIRLLLWLIVGLFLYVFYWYKRNNQFPE
jgi:hypothetical protein